MFLLVKIHANWCPHCVNLRPEWSKLLSNINTKSYRPEVFDIEEQQMHKLDSLNQKYNLKSPIQSNGYPTIVKVYKGKPEYFQGNRDSESMTKWLYENVKSQTKKMKKSKKANKKSKKTKQNKRNRTAKNRTTKI